MPIIKFTPADVLRNKVLEANWYGAEIVKVSDWKPSKDADSHNMTVTFLIEKTDGKEIDRLYNTKAISMMIPLITAATGIVVKPEEFNFNTDDLVGKKVDVKVDIKTYEGRLGNEINDFVPYQRSSSAASY